ncbi:MAG: AAA family ATPase [Candidatus Schekmanbacteria bacterium]|nr:AAA family ATPase [Candidatus Schekmanbacteria bacterium]
MYKSFYHLKENPFSLNPDPHFLFPSEQHKEAYKLMLYAIDHREGLLELVGEVGCGKTMLCRVLLSSLGENVKTALILNPPATRTEFLETLMEDLGRPFKNKSYKDLLQDLANFLTGEYAKGNNVAVFIDEAQDLNIDVLEGIRFLTNIETNKKKLIQVVLVGQPELEINLRTPQLRHVDQRIGLRCHLRPLNKKEMAEYIYHRLKVAGTDEIKFSQQALRRIYSFSKGIPRLINQVCDKTLITAYFYKQNEIDAKTVGKALRTTQKRWFRFRIPQLVYSLHAAFAFALVCILVLFAVNWYMQTQITTWTNQVNPTLGIVRGSISNRMHLAPEIAEASKTSPASGTKAVIPVNQNNELKQDLTEKSKTDQDSTKNLSPSQSDIEKIISRQLAALTEQLNKGKEDKKQLGDKEKDINQRLTKLNEQLEELKKILNNKETKTSLELGKINEQLQKTQTELNQEKEAKQQISDKEKAVNLKLAKLNDQLDDFKKQLAARDLKAGQDLSKLTSQLQKTQFELNQEKDTKLQLAGKEKAVNLKLVKLNDQLEDFKKQSLSREQKTIQDLDKMSQDLIQTRQQLQTERNLNQQAVLSENNFNHKLADLNTQLDYLHKELTGEKDKNRQLSSITSKVDIEIARINQELINTKRALNKEKTYQAPPESRPIVQPVKSKSMPEPASRQNMAQDSSLESIALTGLFKLWGREVNPEEAASWPIKNKSLDFKTIAARHGLEAIVLATDIDGIIKLNLPCILLPAGNLALPTLLSQASESEFYSQNTVYSVREFNNWRGSAVILWENIDKLREGDIPLEDNVETAKIAARLYQLGYLAQDRSDIQQISYALLNFQRDHSIPNQSMIETQTKLILYRIINQPVTPTLTREFI